MILLLQNVYNFNVMKFVIIIDIELRLLSSKIL